MIKEMRSVGQTGEINPLVRYKCDQAIQLLRQEISDIPDVQTWAYKSRGGFITVVGGSMAQGARLTRRLRFKDLPLTP